MMEKQADAKEQDVVSRRAMAFFEEGYNCCQSVFLAFAGRYGFDRELACRLSASFGGGVGRLREICGTVSAMALVCGLETGATEGSDQEGKAANYAAMQQLAARFEAQSGSLICRELLGLDGKKTDAGTQPADNGAANGRSIAAMAGGMGNFKPQERTEQYYATRPCKQLVGLAAGIIEQWLEERQ